MDFVKQFTQNNNGEGQQQQNQGQGQVPAQEGAAPAKQGGGSFFDGIGDKLNSAAGGGRESEKNEDMLDKGIDFVQEKFLGQGKQDDESAVEQAKDEQISDFIRGKYKTSTGTDFPIEDKPTRFG